MSKVDDTDEDPVGLPRPLVVLAFGAGAVALAGLFIAAAHAAGLGADAPSVWADTVSCCTASITTPGG